MDNRRRCPFQLWHMPQARNQFWRYEKKLLEILYEFPFPCFPRYHEAPPFRAYKRLFLRLRKEKADLKDRHPVLARWARDFSFVCLSLFFLFLLNSHLLYSNFEAESISIDAKSNYEWHGLERFKIELTRLVHDERSLLPRRLPKPKFQLLNLGR